MKNDSPVGLAVIITLCMIGFILLFNYGCSENSRAKVFGGTITINLPKGEKLIEATWKESNLWYLTRPMRENETAENYTFQENSTYGLIEGTVIFIETE